MEASTIEAKYQSLLALEKEISNPKLQFVLLIHAINLAHDLKCTGLLEDDPEVENVLPKNWTKDSEGVYSFRYYDSKAKDTIYLKIIIEDVLVDINAVTAQRNDKIISLGFKISDYSSLDKENLTKIYKKYRNEFLVKVLPHLKPAQEEEKSAAEPRRIIVQNDDDRGILWNIPRNQDPFANVLRDYGRNDLFPVPNNPYGIHSGGNLLGPRDPFFQGGQPFPQNQPNIRYDPTGPLGIDPTTPDPDIGFPPIIFPRRDPNRPFGGPGGPGGPGGFGGFGGGGGLI